MREAQRKRAEATALAAKENQQSSSSSPAPSAAEKSTAQTRFAGRAPDIAAAQASVQAAGQKAGAYLSSWGAWANERKKGWTEGRAGVGGEGKAGGGSSASSEQVASGTGSGSVGTSAEQKSPGKLARWSSSASLSKKTTREEKGRDGIGRLDA